MIEMITTFLSSGGLGGIVGVVGSAVGKWLKNKNEIARMKIEMDLLERKTELQMKYNLQEGSFKGLVESIRADAVADGNAYKWVSSIKSLFRPFITVCLVGISAWLIIGGYVPEITLEQSISCVLNLTSVAILWWFGDRTLLNRN